MDVLMIGTGEYTTGYVHGKAAVSDKSAGVVALTCFDLRRRGKVDVLRMAGTNGTKFPGIRRHLEAVVGQVYRDMDIRFSSYPSDDVSCDPTAYCQGIDEMQPGDVAIVFTPDDTHFEIAMHAVQAGLHVLIAKPLTKTLEEHLDLARVAASSNVLVAMEVHKRWDPLYIDARDRIRGLGDFSFFQSYMSQPKSQLETFRRWAGKASDISYYLNAHHIDFHAWANAGLARPLSVQASAATGVAHGLDIDTEDTISLMVQWENTSGNLGTAIYTSSWIASRSDVHSQQRFFYMGHDGEVTLDQAHRGYSLSTDESGMQSLNPLFMKYTPDSKGDFVGQSGYGYRSIEDFVSAATMIRSGGSTPNDYCHRLATIDDTIPVTAVLEAGRRSLDRHGATIAIPYDEEGKVSGF
ncbi:MAG: Gfo/Idh/MocA family oxidoreductase [Pirellulaceae bacterium]|nr:Gfo/Idh/MocA family oxidoreductase [Planctomycetaceae bacterium]